MMLTMANTPEMTSCALDFQIDSFDIYSFFCK